jgi:hypothetical protein
MSTPRFASLAASCLAGAVCFTVTASEMGQAAADAVSQTYYTDLLNYSLYTHAGHSRGPTGAQHDLARNNILALFQSYGLTAVLEPFTWSGQSGENVVATQLGVTYPSKIFIIGAHYDSVSNPGADDNASGTAAVLEAARVLSQYPSEYTIKYIAFDLEELGLYGSKAYTAAHAADDIRGMISLDMVAYDPNTNTARIYGRTASNPIKTALASAVAEYSNGLSSVLYGQLDQSDHAPFEARGWQACLLIESQAFNNPYYHTQNDKWESANYLNFAFATKMVRSTVGYLVDAAEVTVPVDALTFAFPDGLPAFSRPNGTTRFDVQIVPLGAELPEPNSGVLHYNFGAGWQVTPLVEREPDLYEVQLPAGACGGNLQFYISALSTDGQVYTSPRHAPATTHNAKIAYGTTTFFDQPLNTDPNWTRQGLWAFGQPTGGGGQYGSHDPNQGHTGLKVYGYNLTGDYENNLPERHLTSTAIDCTGRYGVHLNFWRWLGVETPTYDHAYVRVSNNNTTWTTIWQNTGEVADTAWTFVDLDISAIADNQPNVYLRWTMGTTDTAWQYCGWNVDDISLTALECTAPLISGDADCDGDVDFFDIDPFILALGGQEAYNDVYPDCPWLSADADADGDVDFFDIDPLVLALSGETAYLAQYPNCQWLNGDTDGDNDVDFFDIDPFVVRLGSACP